MTCVPSFPDAEEVTWTPVLADRDQVRFVSVRPPASGDASIGRYSGPKSEDYRCRMPGPSSGGYDLAVKAHISHMQGFGTAQGAV
jgi:hypothetical protein